MPFVLTPATSQLQSALQPSPPWSFTASRLLALLKQYSTGLSFPVAADELSLLWRDHLRQHAHPHPKALTATVTHVAPGPPELWLVRLHPDLRPVAVYAPSAHIATVAPGAVLAFPPTALVKPRAPPGAVPDVLRALRAALAHASPAPNPHCPPASHSPVDIAKFPARAPPPAPESAATPSQPDCPENPAADISSVVYPTSALFFELGSVGRAALALPEPPEAFSLQRVWDDRSLTPVCIYAAVACVERQPELAVRLQDLPTHDAADQPSVLLRLPVELHCLAELLQPGFHLLMRNPLVQPTGNSFEITCAAHTKFYYADKMASKRPVTPGRSALQDITNTGPVQAGTKRRRMDPDLSKSMTAVSMMQVAELVNPGSQSEFVTHARVIGVPNKEESYLCAVPCEHSVTVRVVGPTMVRRAAQIAVGDEIVLQGMKWATPSTSSEGRTPAGWIAASIDNVSNMTGILCSPLTRNVTPLRNCIIPDAKTSQTSAQTCHVSVRILDAIPNPEGREVVLSVTDCNPEHISFLGDVNENAIGRGRAEDIQDEAKATESCNREWKIKVRDSCFETLFWSNAGTSLWEADTAKIILECLPRLRTRSWLMTLTIYPPTESRLPEMCACVPFKCSNT